MAAARITEDQRRDLRQLAGASPFKLWVKLYSAGSNEAAELGALVARCHGDLRLAAAELLDGLVDGAETIRKLKLEGELEVEFLPVQYAARSQDLRAQVLLAAASTQRYGPPLVGIAVGRTDAPQVFGLSNLNVPGDRQRLGEPPIPIREGA